LANVNRYVNTGSTAGGDGTVNTKTGSTRAYPTRASWNTSEATNLVTDGDIHILYCDGDGGTDDATRLTMSAWTTGASNYITVTSGNSYQHRGTANYAKWFQMNEDYFREDGYIGENLATFANSSNNDSVINVDAAGGSSSDIRFTNVHILSAPREGIIHAGGVGYYDNLLLEDCSGNYGIYVTYNSSAPNGTVIRHATIVNSGSIEALGALSASYVTVKNCYAHDNGSTNGGYSSTIQTNYVTCAASDTTGSSGALDSVAFSTTNFESVTAGSEDLHIKSGSNLNGGGTDISADTNWVSTDLDGTAWETTPSVGCYELVSGGTTVETITDALVLAEGQAAVEAATVVNCTTHALALAEGQASIEAGAVIETNTHALTLSEGQADVEAAVVVNTVTHALVLAEGQATIDTSVGAIETVTHALVLAEGVASIEAATVVNCNVHALTLSASVASIITTAPSADYSVIVENQMIAELSDTLFPIDVAVDSTGGVTGLSITAALRDPNDNTSYLDWSDLTFKTSGWTTKFQSLTEYGSGFYGTNLDVSGITNFPSANHAAVEYDISGTVVAVSQGLLSLSQTWFQAQALTVGKFLGLK